MLLRCVDVLEAMQEQRLRDEEALRSRFRLQARGGAAGCKNMEARGEKVASFDPSLAQPSCREPVAAETA